MLLHHMLYILLQYIAHLNSKSNDAPYMHQQVLQEPSPVASSHHTYVPALSAEISRLRQYIDEIATLIPKVFQAFQNVS